jgi:hypothetical protein
MAGIFGARMKGAWPIPAPVDPTGKALISGHPDRRQCDDGDD